MDYNKIEKIVVAPQIVIYKNLFKNSNALMESLKTYTPESCFLDWKDWYGQGQRRFSDFNRNYTYNNGEQEYLLEICDAFEFIKKDYFEQFGDEKGIWPSFIKDWSKVKEQKPEYEIDYFKYDLESVSKIKQELLMQYHVDEFPMISDFKTRRHVITVNFYLNDEYDGGEICAYDSISNKSYRYKPGIGDAVVMPSTEPFYHAVKCFEGADRYFLRIFVDYKRDPDEHWVANYSLQGDNPITEIENVESEYIKKDLQTIKISSQEVNVNEIDYV
jgi:hypothetical protein